MSHIEIFGVDVFFGFTVLGAILSLVLWVWVTARIKPSLIHGPVDTAAVLLSHAAFIGVDGVLLWGVAIRPDPYLFRVILAFVFGIQLVAAFCAALSQRQRHAKARVIKK